MSGVTDLTYQPWKDNEVPLASTSQTFLFDLIRGMSIMNSKNYEYTDRKGNLQGVLCDITITANTSLHGDVAGLPNSWKLRNATRKFHFLREEMFRRAGVTKSERGKYGQTLRPYFDLHHFEDASKTTQFAYWETDPVQVGRKSPVDSNGLLEAEYVIGGEWTRSQLVSADAEHSALAFPVSIDSADTWDIYFADNNVANAPPWTAVGMMHSYNLDRMEVVTPDASETLTPNNPLALLKSQTVTGGDVTEVAEEMELEAPPYDIKDDGDSTAKIFLEEYRLQATSESTTGETTLRNVFLPAGYCTIGSNLMLTPGSGTGEYLQVRFDVHGIFDCKDWIEA